MRAIKWQVLKQLRNGRLHDRHLRVIHNVQFVNQTEEFLDFQELEQVLRDSMEQLPPRCREVFRLSRYENLTNKEIAARMNISAKTVEVQITKALSILRATLNKAVILLFFLFG